jgi:hypothetical protein
VGEWRADQQMRRMASDSRTRIVLTFACSNCRGPHSMHAHTHCRATAADGHLAVPLECGHTVPVLPSAARD